MHRRLAHSFRALGMNIKCLHKAGNCFLSLSACLIGPGLPVRLGGGPFWFAIYQRLLLPFDGSYALRNLPEPFRGHLMGDKA